jgi:hypothetical protein
MHDKTSRRLRHAFEEAFALALAMSATAAGSLACSSPSSTSPSGSEDAAADSLICPTLEGGIVILDGGFPSATVDEPDGAAVVVGDAGPGTVPGVVQCEDLCSGLCDPQHSCPYPSCTYVLTDSGQPAVSCASWTIPCGTGRRPPGLDGLPRRATDPGTYFAEVARLEAASVDAFELLATELRAYRAPAALVRRARSAAWDEVRHARAAGDLSRRFGKPPWAPRLATPRRRSLSAIALDNAVEGCVNETFGALLAAWQARSAADGEVRTTMRRIARDEARHAALGWDVMRWTNTRLGSRGKKQAARAAERAFAQLDASFAGRDAETAFQATVGLPTNAQARVMLRVLRDVLWTPDFGRGSFSRARRRRVKA